ncbi:MAG: DEAD/DEAH box helicase [Beijerinckiaceae bacterium]|nr:MAG: DEAD/DEAH box helicase [Beijerinckiaceae bacterium]
MASLDKTTQDPFDPEAERETIAAALARRSRRAALLDLVMCPKLQPKDSKDVAIAAVPHGGYLVDARKSQVPFFEALGLKPKGISRPTPARGETLKTTTPIQEQAIAAFLKGDLVSSPALIQSTLSGSSFDFAADRPTTLTIASAFGLTTSAYHADVRLDVPNFPRVLGLARFATRKVLDKLAASTLQVTALESPDALLVPPFLTYAAKTRSFLFVSHPDAGLDEVLIAAQFRPVGEAYWISEQPLSAMRLKAFADQTLAILLETIYARWPFALRNVTIDVFSQIASTQGGTKPTPRKATQPPLITYDRTLGSFLTEDPAFALTAGFAPLSADQSQAGKTVFSTTDLSVVLAHRSECDDDAEAEILARLVIAAVKPALPDTWLPPAPAQPYAYDPDQINAIRFAMRGENILIGDDMGFGKSFEAAGIIDSIAVEILDQGRKRPPTFLYLLPAKERDKIGTLMADVPSTRLQIRRLDSEYDGSHPAIMAVTPDTLLDQPKDCPGFVVVASYEKAVDTPEIFSIVWDGILFDESHKIKNIQSGIGKTLIGTNLTTNLKAGKYVWMSGTQFTDTMTDYWPFLKVLLANDVTPLKRFKAIYAYDKKDPEKSPEALARIARLSEALDSGVRLRRTKEEKRLTPGKYAPEIVTIEIDDPEIVLAAQEESDLYDSYHAVGSPKAKTAIKHKINALRRKTGAAKLPEIARILASDAAKAPIVVFAYHTDIADAFAAQLAAAALPKTLRIATIHGRNATPGQRAKVGRDFQAGLYDALITTIDASALGGDYTYSRDVSIIELDWKWYKIAQAIDRLDRRAQIDLVRQRYFVIKNSFDDVVARNMTSKSRVAIIANGDDRRALKTPPRPAPAYPQSALI